MAIVAWPSSEPRPEVTLAPGLTRCLPAARTLALRAAVQ